MTHLAIEKCPEWEWSDPLRDVKIVCWHLLRDAKCKSVMSNDLARGTTLTSTKAASEMIAARRWIMALDDQTDPKCTVDGIGSGFCLNALDISRYAFIPLVKALWLSHRKIVMGTLRSQLKSSREASRRYKQKLKGPVKYALAINVALEGADMVKRSEKWEG